MKPLTLVLGLVAGALVLSPSALFAQSNANCAERNAVVQRLARQYGESRRSIGLTTGNQVVEVFASDETGTWSITVTLPSGMTCLVAAGENFEALDEGLHPTALGDPA